MTQLPPGLRDRVLASRKEAPARGSWPLRLGLWGLFSAGWCGVGLWSTGLRDDWASLPVWYRLASLAAIGGSAGALSVLGMMRGRRMLGASALAQRAALVALPLCLLVWVALVGSMPPSGVDGPSWASLPWCHAFSLLGAAPLLGLLVWFKRGLTVPTPALTGATLGAAAAAWAHAVVFSHCPFNDSLHTSLGHVAPMIPMMLAGALAGYRFFR